MSTTKRGAVVAEIRFDRDGEGWGHMQIVDADPLRLLDALDGIESNIRAARAFAFLTWAGRHEEARAALALAGEDFPSGDEVDRLEDAAAPIIIDEEARA